MSNARDIIDGLVEAQEQAVVRVELTGTPKTVHQALKQLAKSKSGLKKAVDGTVKISEPSIKPVKDDGEDDDKDLQGKED